MVWHVSEGVREAHENFKSLPHPGTKGYVGSHFIAPPGEFGGDVMMVGVKLVF